MPVWMKWQLANAWEKGDKARIKSLNESFFYSLTLKDKEE